MYSLPRKLTYGTWKKWRFGRWYFSVAKHGQPSRIPIWAVEVEGITKNQRNMWMLHMAPPKSNSSPLKMMVPFQMAPFSGTFGAFSQGDWVQRPIPKIFPPAPGDFVVILCHSHVAIHYHDLAARDPRWSWLEVTNFGENLCHPSC